MAKAVFFILPLIVIAAIALFQVQRRAEMQERFATSGPGALRRASGIFSEAKPMAGGFVDGPTFKIEDRAVIQQLAALVAPPDVRWSPKPARVESRLAVTFAVAGRASIPIVLGEDFVAVGPFCRRISRKTYEQIRALLLDGRTKANGRSALVERIRPSARQASVFRFALHAAPSTL